MNTETFFVFGRRNGKFGYFPQEGTRLDNDTGFSLFVYENPGTYEKDRHWWCVVEETSGVAVSHGHNRKEAIDLAESAIREVGAETMQKSIDNHHTRFGWPPNA